MITRIKSDFSASNLNIDVADSVPTDFRINFFGHPEFELNSSAIDGQILSVLAVVKMFLSMKFLTRLICKTESISSVKNNRKYSNYCKSNCKDTALPACVTP